jgi:type II secretory pathway component PulK
MIGNERGIALIITLLVVALLAITVVEFSYSVEIDQRMARNALNGLQATLLARSGINLGEALLLHDDIKKTPPVDAFTQEWCPSPGPDAASCLIDESNSQIVLPENMRLRVQIFDEGAKFNVNLTNPKSATMLTNWQSNPNNTTPLSVFERLCAARGVDAQLSEALLNYWSNAIAAADQAATGSTPGATPGATPRVGTPQQVQANNQLVRNQILAQYEFRSLDDLGVIPGMTPSVINRLRPVLTAFPTVSQGNVNRVNTYTININTAPRLVLNALYPDNPDVVDNIISQRQNGPLQAAQIAQQTGKPGVRVPGFYPSVSSQYFLIRASAIVNPDPLTGRGGIRRSASMLVLRGKAVGGSTSGSNTGPGGLHWTLTQLDWQKEGGAALFEPPKDGEPGTDETANSMVQDSGW